MNCFHHNTLIRYDQKALYSKFQIETVIGKYLNSIQKIWIYTWVLFMMMHEYQTLQSRAGKKSDFGNRLFQIDLFNMPSRNKFFISKYIGTIKWKAHNYDILLTLAI